MCIICMASVLKFKLLFTLCLVSIFVYVLVKKNLHDSIRNQILICNNKNY